MGITPQQAFEAIKVLNPEIVTLHPPNGVTLHTLTDPFWKGANGVEYRFRCHAGIDWPEGVTIWPMPAKKWRKATIDDVIPKYPQKCRVRSRESDIWNEDRILIAVIDSRFVTMNKNGHFGTFCFCEVEDTPKLNPLFVKHFAEGVEELIADKEKKMQEQLSADQPMETAPKDKSILLKFKNGTYFQGYWEVKNWRLRGCGLVFENPIAWRSL